MNVVNVAVSRDGGAVFAVPVRLITGSGRVSADILRFYTGMERSVVRVLVENCWTREDVWFGKVRFWHFTCFGWFLCKIIIPLTTN